MFAETRGLMEITDFLRTNGNFTLAQYGLPAVNQDLVDFYELPLVNHEEDVLADFVSDEDNIDVPDDRNDFINMFYVDAPGGTGKTFLFNTLLKTLRIRRFDTVAVAWTGIAASLLLAGKTAHKAFRLPLKIT
ncbi:unnamed protein product [Brassicogethes aeneus]|uniref:ATP-dependent DNA helicase n=1 Tax=Brassicogethes aeneus TaxID=1431903 RepID=A0A9P0BG93_BRAAE|nr:unnamed protein product [Brassicogethes aeneus]